MRPRSPADAPAPIGAGGWALLLMLVSASVLFFVDRQTLAILKSTLSGEFALNNQDYGFLITGYMVPYTLGYLVSGQIVDRWGTRRCATFYLLGMSVATVACGLARSFPQLLAARVLLGLAESGVVPAIMVLITKRFPRERRGFVVTMHQALQSFGPILSAPLVAALTLSLGWRWSFWLPGSLGFVLAAAWFLSDPGAGRETTGVTPVTQRPGGWDALRFVLGDRRMRGVLIARLLTDPAWFFLIYWQAGFLQERGGWTLAELGRWTWLPPAAAAIGNVVIGAWSDRLLRVEAEAPSARRKAMQRLVWLAPCLALAPWAAGSEPLVLGMLVLAYVMANGWLTMINVLITDLAPAGAVATSVGILSALGGLTSIGFNYVAGPLVDRFGYDVMFVAAGCLHPLGALTLCRFYRARPSTPASHVPSS